MSHLNEDPLVSPRSALIFRAQILGKSPSGRAKFNRKVRYPAGVGSCPRICPQTPVRTRKVACPHVALDRPDAGRTDPGSKLAVEKPHDIPVGRSSLVICAPQPTGCMRRLLSHGWFPAAGLAPLPVNRQFASATFLRARPARVTGG